MAKELKEDDIKQIVRDEIRKFKENELSKEIKKDLANLNSASREEVIKLIKKSLIAMNRFIYLKSNMWTNEIK